MRKRFLCLLIVWSLAGCAFLEIAQGGSSQPPPPGTAAATDQPGVLARVNGVALTRAELDRRLALVQVLLWLSSGNRIVELNEATHIEKWIESELLAQAAARAGTSVAESDAEAEIRRLLSEGAQSEFELDLQLGLSGLKRADLLAYERRALTVQRFTEQVIWQGASEVEKQSRLATWFVRQRADATIEMPGAKAQKQVTGTYAGSIAPDFTLPDLAGVNSTLSAARGKVILVNFWATWCGPCRREMPAIQQVHADYGAQGLVVWAVNVGEGDTEVRRYVDALELTFPVLMDRDSKVSRLYRVYALPTSFFIGRDGVIRQVAIGEMSGTSLSDYVQRSLR